MAVAYCDYVDIQVLFDGLYQKDGAQIVQVSACRPLVFQPVCACTQASKATAVGVLSSPSLWMK